MLRVDDNLRKENRGQKMIEKMFANNLWELGSGLPYFERSDNKKKCGRAEAASQAFNVRELIF